jgi:hypothetical protein
MLFSSLLRTSRAQLAKLRIGFGALALVTALGCAHSAPSEAPGVYTPFIALYSRGPAYEIDRPLFEQASIQAHITHHEQLGARLISAGPLREPSNGIIGVVVILARDAREAEAWLRGDPAILSREFTGAIASWRTSRIGAYERLSRP